MSGKEEEYRVFVGGLSRDTLDRELESTFSRFGKVVEAQVMLDRETGRPRGFGFVTFADQRSMGSAISELHGRELNGRSISVNKAQPKVGGDSDYGYNSGRVNYCDRAPGRSDCFKCGRPGHWARECTVGEGGGGRFSSRSRYGGGGRGDRFGGGDRYGDRYSGGGYSERDRGVDSYQDRYGYSERDRGVHSDRDRYGYSERDRGVDSDRDRYSSRDRYGSDRYGSDRYPQNGYGKERGYDHDRDGARGSDRYGSGGPARYEGSYRERSGPYDRPSRGRPSSYEDRY